MNANSTDTKCRICRRPTPTESDNGRDCCARCGACKCDECVQKAQKPKAQ